MLGMLCHTDVASCGLLGLPVRPCETLACIQIRPNADPHVNRQNPCIMDMLASDSPVLDHADTDGRLVAPRHGSDGHPVQRQVVHLRPQAWRIFVAQSVSEQRELRTDGFRM